MASPITAIRLPVLPDVPAGAVRGSGASPFRQILDQAVGTTEGLGRQASERIGRFLTGEGEELHEVVMDAQRAQLAFELFTQVRNKVVEAYQEVMRTQI